MFSIIVLFEGKPPSQSQVLGLVFFPNSSIFVFLLHQITSHAVEKHHFFSLFAVNCSSRLLKLGWSSHSLMQTAVFISSCVTNILFRKTPASASNKNESLWFFSITPNISQVDENLQIDHVSHALNLVASKCRSPWTRLYAPLVIFFFAWLNVFDGSCWQQVPRWEESTPSFSTTLSAECYGIDESLLGGRWKFTRQRRGRQWCTD